MVSGPIVSDDVRYAVLSTVRYGVADTSRRGLTIGRGSRVVGAWTG